MKDKHWQILYSGLSIAKILGKIWFSFRNTKNSKNKMVHNKILRGIKIVKELSKTGAVPSTKALMVSKEMANRSYDPCMQFLSRRIRYYEQDLVFLASFHMSAEDAWEESVEHKLALCKMVHAANEIDRRLIS